MIPGVDESRVPTARPVDLDQVSQVELFINGAAMVPCGSASIAHLLEPLQGVPEVRGRSEPAVQNIPE